MKKWEKRLAKMKKERGDACARCWHKEYHHSGSGCTGAGIQFRWSRFLQLRCSCSEFDSARDTITLLKIDINRLRERVEQLEAEGLGLQESLTVIGEVLEQARTKLNTWEPWMAIFGRLLMKYRLVRVPEDIEKALDKAKKYDEWFEGGRCGACHFKEKHLSSCPVYHAEQRAEKAEKALAEKEPDIIEAVVEPRVFCESCQQWLEHNQYYCPLFPDVNPPQQPWYTRVHTKWTECVCLVHTCYDAPKRDKKDAPTYKDFP